MIEEHTNKWMACFSWLFVHKKNGQCSTNAAVDLTWAYKIQMKNGSVIRRGYNGFSYKIFGNHFKGFGFLSLAIQKDYCDNGASTNLNRTKGTCVTNKNVHAQYDNDAGYWNFLHITCNAQFIATKRKTQFMSILCYLNWLKNNHSKYFRFDKRSV